MDKLKHILDACAAVAACGGAMTIVGWLPTILGAVASIMSITWYCYRFYEVYKRRVPSLPPES